jgi:hypothetical protein
MSKQTITRIFVVSLALMIGGILLALVPVIAALCSGTWTFSGSELTDFEPSTDTLLSLIPMAIVGGLVVLFGGIGQFVAWIGALANTSRLQDKTWFVILLVLGLLSFGIIAMLVYILAGPDGTTVPPTGTTQQGQGQGHVQGAGA